MLPMDRHRYGMCEDCGATDEVAAALHGAAAQQVHLATEPILQILLERSHLKKPDVAAGQKLHQQSKLQNPHRLSLHDWVLEPL